MTTITAVLEGRPVVKRRVPVLINNPLPPTIDDMKKALGLDKIRPIAISPSDEKDEIDKGDAFEKWYEEELRDACKRK